MTKYETEMKNKKKALEMFLGEEVENLYDNIFESESGEEYMVLTDDEADIEAEKNIKESLWAFNADFILKHTNFYHISTEEEDQVFMNSLKTMQNTLCEDANGLVYAMIEDIDIFVGGAIEEDGIGHFISVYDEKENEQNGYYIYRME